SSIVIALLAALIPASAQAQQSTTSSSNQPVASFQLPVLPVTAQKEPADAQTLPVSLTAVSEAILRNAGAQIVSDAGIYAPNAQFSEFTPRKLSNRRFRGIGASP